MGNQQSPRWLFSFSSLLAVCLLAACQTVPQTAEFSQATFTPTRPPASATIAPTETPLTPTFTPRQPSPTIPAALPEASHTPAPLAPCVTIFYEGNAQIEVITSQGGRVLVDVYDPRLLSAPASANDILLTTHTHWDHVNDAFLDDFPGQQIFTQAVTLTLPWANIQGIASAHNAEDAFKPEGGTNYIYLIEVAGLRLAHFGDIGQRAFTDEQLAALQPLDIAIIQIANSYSDMSAANQKGIGLIAQLNPRLVIPTHADLDTAKLAVAQWAGLYSENASVRLCKDQLPATTQFLFLGEWAEKFPPYIELPAADW